METLWDKIVLNLKTELSIKCGRCACCLATVWSDIFKTGVQFVRLCSSGQSACTFEKKELQFWSIECGFSYFNVYKNKTLNYLAVKKEQSLSSSHCLQTHAVSRICLKYVLTFVLSLFYYLASWHNINMFLGLKSTC